MKKLMSFVFLLVLAVAAWFGGRALVHRGEIKATIVFDDGGGIRRGDPVVSNDVIIGRVERVDDVDTRKAITVRLDRDHRRAILQDSLFAIDGSKVVVTNTLAVGAPIEDGAIIHAKEDRVSRWLAKHGTSVATYIEQVRARADRLIDHDFDDWTAKTPEWKKEGADSFSKHLDEVKRKVEKAQIELESSHKMDEARHLKERFDRWMSDATR